MIIGVKPQRRGPVFGLCVMRLRDELKRRVTELTKWRQTDELDRLAIKSVLATFFQAFTVYTMLLFTPHVFDITFSIRVVG